MLDEMQAQEDLKLIRRMIEESRRSTGEHWISFFIWGVFGIVASIVSHIQLLHEQYSQIGITWNIYWPFCLALTIWLERKKSRSARTRSFVDRAIGFTWTGIGLAMLFMIFASMALRIFHPMYISGMIAFLIGAGVLISGGLLAFPLLYASAALCWVGALSMLLWPPQAFLIEIAMLLFGYLLPGYELRRRYLKEEAAHAGAA